MVGLWRLAKSTIKRDAVVHIRLEQVELAERKWRDDMLNLGRQMVENHLELTKTVAEQGERLARVDERTLYLVHKAQ